MSMYVFATFASDPERSGWMSTHGGQAARLRGCAPLHSGMREHVAGAHPHASHPAEAWLFIINLALF